MSCTQSNNAVFRLVLKLKSLRFVAVQACSHYLQASFCSHPNINHEQTCQTLHLPASSTALGSVLLKNMPGGRPKKNKPGRPEKKKRRDITLFNERRRRERQNVIANKMPSVDADKSNPVSPEITTAATLAPNIEITPTGDQTPASSTYNVSRKASASENARKAWAARRRNLQASSTRASQRTRLSPDMYVAEPAIDERISEGAKRRVENLRIKRQKQDESAEQTHLINQEKMKALERENHKMNHQMKLEVEERRKTALEYESLRKELESSS